MLSFYNTWNVRCLLLSHHSVWTTRQSLNDSSNIKRKIYKENIKKYIKKKYLKIFSEILMKKKNIYKKNIKKDIKKKEIYFQKFFYLYISTKSASKMSYSLPLTTRLRPLPICFSIPTSLWLPSCYWYSRHWAICDTVIEYIHWVTRRI